VEIIRGLVTSSDTVERTKELLLSIGKDPIIVEKEIPGFIVNRINGMVYLEALRLLELGIATVADIDKGLKLGTGYAMGPFEAMDIIGLDTVLKSRMGIYEQTKDTRFFPPDILRKMVAAGLHGRKTNKGFYEYTPEGKKIV
jgi:3-hydroxybutyryl-CoA dehydrogenase